jgi:hypothetical protein
VEFDWLVEDGLLLTIRVKKGGKGRKEKKKKKKKKRKRGGMGRLTCT